MYLLISFRVNIRVIVLKITLFILGEARSKIQLSLVEPKMIECLIFVSFLFCCPALAGEPRIQSNTASKGACPEAGVEPTAVHQGGALRPLQIRPGAIKKSGGSQEAEAGGPRGAGGLAIGQYVCNTNTNTNTNSSRFYLIGFPTNCYHPFK